MAKQERLREAKQHGAAWFPFNIYPCTIPKDFPQVALHWQDSMELVFVKKGRGIVQAGLTTYTAQAGDIYVFAPGVLHALRQLPGEAMEYENIIFELELLGGAGDICAEKYLLPLQSGRLALPMRLGPEDWGYNWAVRCLHAAEEFNKIKDVGYELCIKGELLLFLAALVGRTGAGKSTVYKLLLGLYQPEAGTVTIGGVKVGDITDRERRTCIGCVEQHFSRVPGTVLEQITLGDPQITGEMAKDAAALAGIDAAIRALPEGYDTVCTEGIFSQGEWQLLSIARAAAADPAVLLLDEITANLDAETEARVLKALRRASAGRTVLSVSHRVYENLGGRTIEIRTRE